MLRLQQAIWKPHREWLEQSWITKEWVEVETLLMSAEYLGWDNLSAPTSL